MKVQEFLKEISMNIGVVDNHSYLTKAMEDFAEYKLKEYQKSLASMCEEEIKNCWDFGEMSETEEDAVMWMHRRNTFEELQSKFENETT